MGLFIAVPAFASDQSADDASKNAGRFVSISGMKATIVDGANSTGTLFVSLSVEARSIEHAADLVQIKPQLRDASTGLLSEFASLHVSPWKPVNAVLLHDRLNALLKKLDPRVKAVHLLAVRAAP